MSETLVEIVARALVKQGFKADERDAADVLAALRDPPPSVIEAGAKAMYEAIPTGPRSLWGDTNEDHRETWRDRFLASWRAALDAGLTPPPATRASEIPDTTCRCRPAAR